MPRRQARQVPRAVSCAGVGQRRACVQTSQGACEARRGGILARPLRSRSVGDAGAVMMTVEPRLGDGWNARIWRRSAGRASRLRRRVYEVLEQDAVRDATATRSMWGWCC